MSGGTASPRTTHPRGQLVLGQHVWGDSWSGGTCGPPTVVECYVGKVWWMIGCMWYQR